MESPLYLLKQIKKEAEESIILSPAARPTVIWLQNSQMTWHGIHMNLHVNAADGNPTGLGILLDHYNQDRHSINSSQTQPPSTFTKQYTYYHQNVNWPKTEDEEVSKKKMWFLLTNFAFGYSCLNRFGQNDSSTNSTSHCIILTTLLYMHWSCMWLSTPFKLICTGQLLGKCCWKWVPEMSEALNKTGYLISLKHKLGNM